MTDQTIVLRTTHPPLHCKASARFNLGETEGIISANTAPVILELRLHPCGVVLDPFSASPVQLQPAAPLEQCFHCRPSFSRTPRSGSTLLPLLREWGLLMSVVEITSGYVEKHAAQRTQGLPMENGRSNRLQSYYLGHHFTSYGTEKKLPC